MNLDQLARSLALRLGISHRLAKALVRAFFEEIAQALIRNERVELRGFGSFSVKTASPRRVKNPRNKREYVVPGRRKVVFKAGSRFVAALNEESSS